MTRMYWTLVLAWGLGACTESPSSGGSQPQSMVQPRPALPMAGTTGGAQMVDTQSATQTPMAMTAPTQDSQASMMPGGAGTGMTAMGGTDATGAAGAEGTAGVEGTEGAAGAEGAEGAEDPQGTDGTGAADPTQTCIADAAAMGRSGACADCGCMSCLTELDDCQDEACQAIVTCGQGAGCKGTDCYCGVGADSLTCAINGATGPCMQEIVDGSGLLGTEGCDSAELCAIPLSTIGTDDPTNAVTRAQTVSVCTQGQDEDPGVPGIVDARPLIPGMCETECSP